MRLTDSKIQAIKPPATGQDEHADHLVPGLRLRVGKSGRKSWIVRARLHGRSKNVTLGQYPVIALADARQAARSVLIDLAKGADPMTEKRLQRQERLRQADLTENILDAFIYRHVVVKTKASTAEIFKGLIENRIKPAWRGKPINEISRRDVLALTDAVADAGFPVAANRTFSIIRRFFSWCVERGIVEASPCAGLRAPTKETSRDRTLSDDELRLVWLAAERIGWPFGPMTQLLILTGQRRGEVTGMRWSELEGNVWIIPRERVKNGREHAVPLAGQALDILENLPRLGDSPLIFTTNGKTSVSGFSKGKRHIDAAVKALAGEDDPLDPWTLHDLRRTFASGCARLGQPIHVVEKLLNHASGSFSGVAGVYQRHDFSSEKRRAMDVWAQHVVGLIEEGKPAGNVVPLSGIKKGRDRSPAQFGH